MKSTCGTCFAIKKKGGRVMLRTQAVIFVVNVVVDVVAVDEESYSSSVLVGGFFRLPRCVAVPVPL